MALWTPERLATPPVAWWKGDAGLSTAVDGAAISQWDDQSGNDYHLVQATGGVQPTLDAADLNGLNVVDFASASSQRLEIANSLGLSAQPFTVYGVWFMANSVNQALLHMESGGANDPFAGIDGSGNLSTFAGSGITSAITKAAWRMTGSGFNGASSWRVIDGGTRATGNAGAGTPNGTKTTIGSLVAESSFFLNGSIAEIVVTGTAVSQDDEDLIFGYLAHKWGLDGSLPGGHPYENTAPTFGTKTGLRFCISFGLRQRTLR
jgi:hypothetical protein